MKLFFTEAGPVLTKTYLIFDEDSKEAFLIDAPPDSFDTVSEWIKKEGISLKGILLTHTHWDHTADVPKISREFKAPVYVVKEDEHRLIDPNKHRIFALPFELEGMKPDKYVKDGGIIECNGIKLVALLTPGHTEGGVCYVNHEEKTVFAGDTLFFDSVGRTDLPGGDGDTLLESIKTKLMVLPGDYIVKSGHGPDTSIGREKEKNPFLIYGLL